MSLSSSVVVDELELDELDFFFLLLEERDDVLVALDELVDVLAVLALLSLPFGIIRYAPISTITATPPSRTVT